MYNNFKLNTSFLTWSDRFDCCFLHCIFCPLSVSSFMSAVYCSLGFLDLKLNIVPFISPSLLYCLSLIPFSTLVHPILTDPLFSSLSPCSHSLVLSFQQQVSENVKYNEECLSCNTHWVSILIDQWSLHQCLVSLRTSGWGWVLQHVMY